MQQHSLAEEKRPASSSIQIKPLTKRGETSQQTSPTGAIISDFAQSDPEEVLDMDIVLPNISSISLEDASSELWSSIQVDIGISILDYFASLRKTSKREKKLFDDLQVARYERNEAEASLMYRSDTATANEREKVDKTKAKFCQVRRDLEAEENKSRLVATKIYASFYIDSTPDDFLGHISPDDRIQLVQKIIQEMSKQPSDGTKRELDKLYTVLSKGKDSKECKDAVSVYRNMIFMELDEKYYDFSNSPIKKKGRFLSKEFKSIVEKFPPSISCYSVTWGKMKENDKIKPKVKRLNPDANDDVPISKKRSLSGSTPDLTQEGGTDSEGQTKRRKFTKAEPGDEFRNALSKYIDAHLRRTDDNKKYILMNEFLEEFRVHCEKNENGLFNEHKDDMLSKQPNCSNKGKFNKMVLSILNLEETALKRTSRYVKITNFERVS